MDFDLMKGFEIEIIDKIPYFDFYIYRRNGNKLEVIEPIEPFTVRTVVEGAQPLVPTIRLDKRMALDTMKRFVEVLEKENIKTDNQNKSEAKLEVTEKWLEDMRKLVFKDEKE